MVRSAGSDATRPRGPVSRTSGGRSRRQSRTAQAWARDAPHHRRLDSVHTRLAGLRNRSDHDERASLAYGTEPATIHTADCRSENSARRRSPKPCVVPARRKVEPLASPPRGSPPPPHLHPPHSPTSSRPDPQTARPLPQHHQPKTCHPVQTTLRSRRRQKITCIGWRFRAESRPKRVSGPRAAKSR